jgi:hypothetical protein
MFDTGSRLQEANGQEAQQDHQCQTDVHGPKGKAQDGGLPHAVPQAFERDTPGYSLAVVQITEKRKYLCVFRARHLHL